MKISNSRSPLLLAACGAALCAGARELSAQLIVGNDQSGTATIYEVNVSSGVATPLYSSANTDAKPWGMAYDPQGNTLYWNNGSTLFSSPYGPTLTPTSVPLTYNSATVNFVALAFRNGKLLGTRNIATEAVYEVDPATGVSTLLYTYPSTLDFGGLDVDYASGVLYGLSDTGQQGLHRIDVPGQSTTLLFPYPAGETDIDGLAVHGGRAYLVTDGPNTTQASFYVYDIASGQQIATLPSPFTGSGTFAAAAFIAPTGRLVAVDSSRALFAIDPLSGLKTQIGTVSTNAGTTAGLAFDPENHIVYLTSTSLDALFTLDLNSGQATLVGSYSNPALVMHGLEYDSRNRVLYGASSHDGGLYRIDTQTGQETLVGLTGLASFVNLGYDSRTDTLYASNSGADSFYTIDRSTGVATLINNLGGPTNPNGLAYDAAAGVMYLVDNSTDQLYRVDLASGFAQPIGSTGAGNLLGLVHIARGSNIVRREHGCGSATLRASGAAALGSNFTLQLTGTGSPFLGVGLTSFELPICSCILGHDWSTSFPTGTLSVGIPNDPLLIGGQVALQGLDLGAVGGCPVPAFELTDTLIVTIER